ncbi:uncharacterized protein EI90DRAFT_110700 [Cantharellus anzutake]|uniref:uncharacterized protein n=1 Tax=Cantharellus anzutake TaxID=1750568 RepID=UPI001908B872|nr:uncharacterized protein EI90DRAFT_110700 [Cantharellus anzutake]KAF8337105.1 hypothetical protein EI90DRAFT_110700 [Cantharellus anzutake]
MAPLRTEGMGLNSVPHPVNRDTFASNVAYPPGTILLHGDEIEDEDPESFFETQLGFNVLHSSIEPIDNDSTKSHSLAQTSATYSTISGFSTFSGGSLIPFRRAGCTYPLRDLCEEVIEKHVWLQIARIVSTSCYCFYRNLILHRFLLFQLRRPEKKDIWMRIDRTAGLSLFRLIMKRGKTHIGDIFSAAKEALIKRARRENDQTFKRLPFLGDFCIFFRVIAEEMLEYKTWPETSWVFCSIVQEYLGISGDGHYAFGGPITRNTAPLIRSRILRMVTYVTPNTVSHM